MVTNTIYQYETTA